MSERHEPKPVIPEYLTVKTVNKMPLEQVYFMKTEITVPDMEGGIADMWVDAQTGHLMMSGATEIDTDNQEYPDIKYDEPNRVGVMRVELLGGDGVLSSGFIADLRRVAEGALPVEHTDLSDELEGSGFKMNHKNVIEIAAFASFDQLAKNADDVLDEDRVVTISGNEQYYDAVRYLVGQVDEMRGDKVAQDSQAYQQLEAEAETIEAEKARQKTKKAIGETAVKPNDRRIGGQ